MKFFMSQKMLLVLSAVPSLASAMQNRQEMPQLYPHIIPLPNGPAHLWVP